MSIVDWLLSPVVVRIATVAAAFILLRVAAALLNRSWNRTIKDRSARHQARKATHLLSYALFLIISAIVFSSQLGGLTVAFGVATAGIAFALQEVIASFAGWLAILTGQFYKTGDRVQLGGIAGDVIDIGILRTTIMETGAWVKGDLYNGRTVRVANSFVFKEPVYNYSAGFPFLWDEFTVPVKYGSDLKEARAIMERITFDVVGDYTDFARQTWAAIQDQFMVEDAETMPMVSISFNDNWVEFVVRYVVAYKKRRWTRDQLSQRLLTAFDESEGRVALASATFHLVEAPPFDVRLRSNG